MSDNPHSVRSVREYKESEQRKREQEIRKLANIRERMRLQHPELYNWLSRELKARR